MFALKTFPIDKHQAHTYAFNSGLVLNMGQVVRVRCSLSPIKMQKNNNSVIDMIILKCGWTHFSFNLAKMPLANYFKNNFVLHIQPQKSRSTNKLSSYIYQAKQSLEHLKV